MINGRHRMVKRFRQVTVTRYNMPTSQYIMYETSQYIMYETSQYIMYETSQYIMYEASQYIMYETSQYIMYDMVRDLKFQCLVLRESGSEFQRTPPEYTRLDFKRSVLGIGILTFQECRDWFRGKFSRKRGWTFPDIIL